MTRVTQAPKLREYQIEAGQATLAAWAGGLKRPALLLATGLGKTVIFAELSRLTAQALGRRPLILVHRDELVRQTVAKLRDADPSMAVGVIQGPRLEMYGTDVVVASVQTLVRRLDSIMPTRFDCIIVDECHHAAAKSYMAILEHFGAFDTSSRTLTLGVTATMGRGDGLGLGEVWEKVVFERDIKFGVENKFLVPAEVRTVKLAGLDTGKIRKGADGDFAPGALAKAMAGIGAGPVVARAYVEFAQADGRLRRGIVFTSTVETAVAWAADFRELGVRAEVVTGETSPEERQGIYARVSAGTADVILSVMVLTEGFDLPAVEVAVIGRPTKSMPLLTQMVGRVLRPSPGTGKQAALVIDVVGAMGAGLARTCDLGIPEPEVPVTPEEAAEPREKLPAAPGPEVPIPGVDWLAVDLHGRPIPPAERKAGHAPPSWMLTYGGTPFLPATLEYPALLYVLADGTLMRKPKYGRAEPLVLAPGVDVRDIHPGSKVAPDFLKATEKQVALLRRLGLLAPGAERPSLAVAGDLLAVHFASEAIDR